MRRNARLVLILAGVYAAFAVASTLWFATAVNVPWGWYILGALHSAVAATILHMLNTAVLAHEPEAVFQLRGAWGEDNTRTELQKAKRRHLVWGWVDSIALQAGDLDHVVVTRSGGVVVIDSKFRTAVTAAGVAQMTQSAKRARLRAEALARTVLSSGRSGRHRAASPSVTVTACIVLWGPARHSVPEGYVLDGVHFVDGPKLVSWMGRLPMMLVSEAAGTDLLERLARYRATTAEARP